MKREHLRGCRRHEREGLRLGNEIRKQAFVYRERAKVLCIKVTLITRSECSQTRPGNNHTLTTHCVLRVCRKHRQSSSVICLSTKNLLITASTLQLLIHTSSAASNKESSRNRSVSSRKLTCNLSLSAWVALFLRLTLDGAGNKVQVSRTPPPPPHEALSSPENSHWMLLRNPERNAVESSFSNKMMCIINFTKQLKSRPRPTSPYAARTLGLEA